MIKIKLLDKNARMPFKAHPVDAGFDVFASREISIPPRSRALVSTGIALALPKCVVAGHNYYVRVAPRSGLAVKSGIDVFAGVIDASYRGECKVCLFNSSDEVFDVKIGDRIAQFIPTLFLEDDMQVVDQLDKTARSDGGFGSSGKN